MSSNRLARRAPEFVPQCNVSLLLEPRYYPALHNLIQLSLYDCGLQSLAGIEQSNDRLEPLFPKLDSLDLGRNPKLTNDSIPETFHTQFPQLTQLWLDDCALGAHIPSTLLELSTLRVVRITGNKLEGELEDGIGIRYWRELKVLALDGNKLTSVGRGIGFMKYLEKLHLRGNALEALPEGVPSSRNTSLNLISLSSNKLTSLPDSLVEAVSLKELYLNQNQIDFLPEGLADKLWGIDKLNLAHNNIGKGMNLTAGSQNSTDGDDVFMEDALSDTLPKDFVDRFGMPDLSGNCTKDDSAVVRLEGNPLANLIRKRHLDEENRRAKRKAMEMAMETELIE